MRISDWSSDVCSSDLLARDLRDRAGGQAQIDRTAIRTLHMNERPGHHQRKLVGIGRIEIGKVGLAHADQQRIDRLVRAALRWEERRVGKERGRTCSSRWRPYH